MVHNIDDKYGRETRPMTSSPLDAMDRATRPMTSSPFANVDSGVAGARKASPGKSDPKKKGASFHVSRSNSSGAKDRKKGLTKSSSFHVADRQKTKSAKPSGSNRRAPGLIKTNTAPSIAPPPGSWINPSIPSAPSLSAPDSYTSSTDDDMTSIGSASITVIDRDARSTYGGTGGRATSSYFSGDDDDDDESLASIMDTSHLFPEGPPPGFSNGRARRASFFNVGNVEMPPPEDDEDEAGNDHIPLTSGGYGGKQGGGGGKPARSPKPEDDPRSRLWRQWQALKLLGNYPIVARPAPHIPGTPIKVAFGPFLEKRQARAAHLLAMQTTWAAYGKHKKSAYLVSEALRSASVTSSEFDQMILAHHGEDIFGDGSGPVVPGGRLRSPLLATRKSVATPLLPTVSNVPLDVNRHRGKSQAERTVIAAGLVKGAMKAEIPVPRGKWARRLYAVQTSKPWQGLVLAAVLSLMALVAVEPPTVASSPSWTGTVELAVLGILSLDLFARWGHIKGTAFLSVTEFSHLLLLLALGTDFVLTTYGSGSAVDVGARWSRPLRPFLLLYQMPSLGPFVSTAIASVGSLAPVAGVVAVGLVAASVVGVRVFGNDGDALGWTDLPTALISGFILLTKVDSAVVTSDFLAGPTTSLWFIVFLLLAVFLAMNVCLAVVVRTYRNRVMTHTLSVRIQERRGLAAAFALLDNQDGTRLGFMGKHTFMALVRSVFAVPPPSGELENLFNHADSDRDGFIHVLEFFQLCDVLFLRFDNGRKLKAVENKDYRGPLSILKSLICPFKGPAWWKTVKKGWANGSAKGQAFAKNTMFRGTVALVVAAHAVLITLWVGGALAQNDVETEAGLAVPVHTAIVMLYVLELLVKVIGQGKDRFWHGRENRLDTWLVAVSFVGTLSILIGYVPLPDGEVTSTFTVGVTGAIADAAWTAAVLGVYGRLLTTIPPLVRVGQMMGKVIVTMFRVGVLVGLVMFAYAVAGMDTLGAAGMDEFSTIWSSLFTLTTLVTTTSWAGVLDKASGAVGSRTATAYLLSFNGVVVILLLSLLVGVVLELYSLRMNLQHSTPDVLLGTLTPGVIKPKSMRIPRLPALPAGYSREGEDGLEQEWSPEVIVLVQSFVRRWIAIHELSKRKKFVAARTAIASEVLTTERTYVESLERCVAFFKNPLEASAATSAPLVSREDIATIFGSMDVILGVNKALLSDIEKRLYDWKPQSKLGDVFMRASQFLKTYTAYVNGFNRSQDLIEELKGKNKKFAQFIADTEAERTGGQTLESYLIAPVQRIPRYVLLLQDLLKNTWRDHSDFPYLKQAVKSMQGVADYVNEKKRQADSAAKVVEIGKILTGLGKKFVLQVPHRFYICHGPMTEIEVLDSGKSSAPKERIVYLFTDILMITSKKGKKLKVKKVLSLRNVSVESVKDGPAQRNAIRVLHTQYDAVLSARSVRGKAVWIENLNRWIDKAISGEASFSM